MKGQIISVGSSWVDHNLTVLVWSVIPNQLLELNVRKTLLAAVETWEMSSAVFCKVFINFIGKTTKSWGVFFYFDTFYPYLVNFTSTSTGFDCNLNWPSEMEKKIKWRWRRLLTLRKCVSHSTTSHSSCSFNQRQSPVSHRQAEEQFSCSSSFCSVSCSR